jgi:hypothetical protein
MTFDVCALVRRDHDDLDRALGAMTDPATPPKELGNLLEVFSLGLAVHVAAEARMFDLLLGRLAGPRALAMLVSQARGEHLAQREVTDALGRIRPSSIDWYARALELRVLVVDHAERADYGQWTLRDHVAFDLQHELAAEYATERMRVLASTSPIGLAQRRMTALGL